MFNCFKFTYLQLNYNASNRCKLHAYSWRIIRYQIKRHSWKIAQLVAIYWFKLNLWFQKARVFSLVLVCEQTTRTRSLTKPRTSCMRADKSFKYHFTQCILKNELEWTTYGPLHSLSMHTSLSNPLKVWLGVTLICWSNLSN